MPTPLAPESPPAQAEPSTGKSMAYVYAGYLLRYVYLLVLIPYYGRVLGAQEYGRVLTAMALYQIVWMLAEYGFPTAGVRDLQGGRDPVVTGREFGRHLSGRLWTSAFAALIGVGGVVMSPVLHERPALGLLAVAAGVLSAFNLGWFFTATLRFRTSVMLEVLGFCINLTLILTLVRGPGDGEWVMVTLLASGGVATVVAYALAWRQLAGAAVAVCGGLRLIRETFTLFIARSVTMVMSNASTYLLAWYVSAEQVGYFGAAERLASACISLLQPAQQVLVGTINFRLSGRDRSAAAYGLMWHSLLLHAAYGVVAWLGTLLVAPYIVPLALGPGFDPSIELLRDLAPLMPLAAIGQYIGGCVLIPMRRDLMVTVVTASGAIALLAGIFAFTPTGGAAATAHVRVLSQGVIAALMIWAVLRDGTLQRILGHRAATP